MNTADDGRRTRERILSIAGDLFARRGVATVTLDDILAAGNIARTTMYRYFRSKDDLIAEYLRRLEEPSRRVLLNAAERDASTPREALVGLFDALGRWFRKPTFCGCVFTNASLALADSPSHPAHRITIAHKDGLRAWIGARVEELDIAETEELSDALMLLLEGSIVSATVRRNANSALHAGAAAARLIDSYVGNSSAPIRQPVLS